MTVLVSYEGVLMGPKNQPIRDGFLLVQALAAANRTVIFTTKTRDLVDHQLRTERLTAEIAEVIDNSVAMEPLPLWQRQIEVARSYWPVTLLLTASPLMAEYAVEHGLASLFFAHPGFSNPPRRPETGNRSWEQLTEELDRRWQGV